MKGNFHLRHILSFQFALVAMAPVVLVGLLLAFFIAPRIVFEVESRNRNMATELSAQVSSYLHEPVTALNAVGDMLDLPAAGSSDMSRILDAHVVSNDIFEAIYLVNASGQVVSVGLPQARQSYRETIWVRTCHGGLFLWKPRQLANGTGPIPSCRLSVAEFQSRWRSRSGSRC